MLPLKASSKSRLDHLPATNPYSLVNHASAADAIYNLPSSMLVLWWKPFFTQPWKVFDFLIVVSSLLALSPAVNIPSEARPNHHHRHVPLHPDVRFSSNISIFLPIPSCVQGSTRQKTLRLHRQPHPTHLTGILPERSLGPKNGNIQQIRDPWTRVSNHSRI